MYRSDLDAKDRGGAIAAVLAIHAGLIFMLLHLSGKIDLTDPQSVMQTFDVERVPSPPPPVNQPPPPRSQDSAKPKQKKGGSSPRNIKSAATPVTAPKVDPLLPNPVVVAETPRQGAEDTQGASTVRDPGTGSGGIGSGTGSGTGGSGPGGGGGGGTAVPPQLLRGITSRDYPAAINRTWPRGAAIFLRLRIEANGRPSQCTVMRGFGNASADQWTCSLVMQRGLFRPARDRRGQPVAAWFGYKQSDTSR